MTNPFTSLYPLLIAITLMTACGGQQKSNVTTTPDVQEEVKVTDPQIAEYIRHIFEDKNGGLWFGTNGYGAVHYDGDSLRYYSVEQGFGGYQITGIAEDPDKNIWFATDEGVVKYEWTDNAKGEKQFINYTDEKYFDGQRFWSVCADSKGNIWAGAERGIYRYDGVEWEAFHLPYPDTIIGDFITEATAWSIIEDSKGNMWYSSNGFGAYRYDGETFTRYSQEDGLTDNAVDHILEDSQGNVWFGTRFGGVSVFDGKTFVTYAQRNNDIGNDEVCCIYEDRSGDIWFSSEGYGIYRYDPPTADKPEVSFTNYGQEQGLGVRAVQTIYEDSQGRFWVGGGGGLYRYEETALPVRSEGFVNVRRGGPWR